MGHSLVVSLRLVQRLDERGLSCCYSHLIDLVLFYMVMQVLLTSVVRELPFVLFVLVFRVMR